MYIRKITLIDGEKYLTCTCCKELKHEVEFSIHTRAASGRNNLCRVCQKYRMKLQNYGVTREQYESMLSVQDHKCKVCGCNETSTRCTHGHLVVDHCHTTGKVRSLLCDMCNKTLGYTKDSIEQLQALIDYLNAHQD